jgi:hypothetical protein
VNFTENMTADNHFLIPVGMFVGQGIDKDLEDIQHSGVTLFMPENVVYGNLSNSRTYHLQSLPVRDKYSLMKDHMCRGYYNLHTLQSRKILDQMTLVS